jgi:hypothetical protein
LRRLNINQLVEPNACRTVRATHLPAHAACLFPPTCKHADREDACGAVRQGCGYRSPACPLRRAGPFHSSNQQWQPLRELVCWRSELVQRQSMRRIDLLFAFLLLAGCSGHASKEDQLNAAANQSTPDAANVLTAAAVNGMNAEAAMNAAADAQARNSSTGAPPRYQARPNSAQNPNPPKAGVPPQKIPAGNSS